MTWRDELQALVDANQSATPADVLALAESDTSSDLHHQFIWDNSIAGQRYRLMQASMLLRRVRVTVTTNEQPPREVRVRAYSHIPSEGAYVPTARALELNADELLAKALSELEALQRKYENLLSWSSVIAAHKKRLRSKRVAA